MQKAFLLFIICFAAISSAAFAKTNAGKDTARANGICLEINLPGGDNSRKAWIEMTSAYVDMLNQQTQAFITNINFGLKQGVSNTDSLKQSLAHIYDLKYIKYQQDLAYADTIRQQTRLFVKAINFGGLKPLPPVNTDSLKQLAADFQEAQRLAQEQQNALYITDLNLQTRQFMRDITFGVKPRPALNLDSLKQRALAVKRKMRVELKKYLVKYVTTIKQNTIAFINNIKAGPKDSTAINIDSLKKLSTLAVNTALKPAPVQKVAVNTDPQNTIASADNEAINYYFVGAPAENANNPFHTVTDEALQASLLRKIAVTLDNVKEQFDMVIKDTLRAAIPPKLPQYVADLKQQISLVTNDTLKGGLYLTIARYYLNYDSISIRRTRFAYQEAALDFTMKALHSFSRYGNSNGLVNCYNNLVKVYKDQRKFSEAKWFILQSNSISRQQNDIPNIISSLVELASIKTSIRDYSLALRDLNEALTLSTQNHFSRQEALVQENFALLYTEMADPKKAAAALKRHDFIEDSLTKAENARRLAAVQAQDSLQQAKKKVYTLAGKKISKTSSDKKTASL